MEDIETLVQDIPQVSDARVILYTAKGEPLKRALGFRPPDEQEPAKMDHRRKF